MNQLPRTPEEYTHFALEYSYCTTSNNLIDIVTPNDSDMVNLLKWILYTINYHPEKISTVILDRESQFQVNVYAIYIAGVCIGGLTCERTNSDLDSEVNNLCDVIRSKLGKFII